MKRYDKRRAGALAVLGVLVGAAALFFGTGAAEATTPCTDSPSNDATVSLLGLMSGGISTESTTSFTNVWVCATPPGTSTEANVTDPNSGNPGKVVYSRHCDSHVTNCTMLVNWTGAEVEPDVDTNAPLNSSAAGTGGSAGIGGGTCTYVNGASDCRGGATLGGVTVNEADVSTPTTHPNNGGGCITVGSTCTPVPSGIGVNVLSGDAGNDTVTVTVGTVSESRDLGGCYGVNAGSTC